MNSLPSECKIPIGMQNGWIPDSSITASSSHSQHLSPFLARLHNKPRGSYGSAWSAKTYDKKQWLQVDLGKKKDITMVATQGRVEYNQWVTDFFITFSNDGIIFEDYKKDNVTKVCVVIFFRFKPLVSRIKVKLNVM